MKLVPVFLCFLFVLTLANPFDLPVWPAHRADTDGVPSTLLIADDSPDSVVWGVCSNSVVWGANPDSVVWGANPDSVVRGSCSS